MPSISPIKQSSTSAIDSVEKGNIDISLYDSPNVIPSDYLAALQKVPIRTNVVLPLIEKTRLRESSGIFDESQLWITCASVGSEGSKTLELILSCSRSEIGEYPIFIAATVPHSCLTEDFLVPRLRMLILAMGGRISTERVYSIFAPELIAELFADIWSDLTGISHYETPYYAAKLSFCTKQTFRNRQATHIGAGGRYVLRPAVASDLNAVAGLCFGFAQESEPFILSEAGALNEARILIHNEQVWVHETQSDSSGPQIACLVAFTRNTQTSATISKVMTSPQHRGYGCAQRLVRQVCKYLLHSGKQSVALYVAHSNIPATKVYHNVGFVGLEKLDNQPIEGVERWTEIGFDQSKVQLGHW